jgi:zinc transporter ZupT
MAEGFSLCVAFLLAGMQRRRIVMLVALAALVTPLGAMTRTLVAPEMSGFGLQVLTALAAGTFLFIAVCDLLPEVFHDHEDTLGKIALLAAGIGTDQVAHWVVG